MLISPPSLGMIGSGFRDGSKHEHFYSSSAPQPIRSCQFLREVIEPVSQLQEITVLPRSKDFNDYSGGAGTSESSFVGEYDRSPSTLPAFSVRASALYTCNAEHPGFHEARDCAARGEMEEGPEFIRGGIILRSIVLPRGCWFPVLYDTSNCPQKSDG